MVILSAFAHGENVIAKEIRVNINERIRAREVRLIGESGEQLGIVPLSEALGIAREQNTDLVEVAPTAAPPVCRLMDYGRFKFEQAQKAKLARKHQKMVEIREIRLRPKIDDHDMEFKIRQAQKFLGEGDKVKVSVMFRGRELSHPQLGRELLDRMSISLKDLANVEKPAGMEGRGMNVVFAPLVSKQQKEPKKKEPPKESGDQISAKNQDP